MIEIIIPGKPFAKQRPRHRKNGHTYTPKDTIAATNAVSLEASLEMCGDAPIDGPVFVAIEFIFSPPPSWSEKKKQAHYDTPHIQRPDLDNLEKLVLDGLNGVVFLDDCQVAELSSIKRWGKHPRTEIYITHFGGDL